MAPGRRRNRSQRRPPPVLAPPGVGGVERYRIETGQVPRESVPSPGLEERSLLGAVVQRLVNPHTPGRHGPMCIHGSTWLGGRCWKCPSDPEWASRRANRSQPQDPKPAPTRLERIQRESPLNSDQSQSPRTPVIGGRDTSRNCSG